MLGIDLLPFSAIVVFSLGSLLVMLLKKYRWVVSGVVLSLTIIIGLNGFWTSGHNWGISDWDLYFSIHTAYRHSILDFHQFPLWNPYTCGGTAGIGDPEFSVLTPTFLLELLFGVETGLRLAIYFSIIVGGWGMLALVKRLRLSPEAGLLAALGYTLGSVTLLEIVEGHVNVFSAMWIPWIFWAWLGSYRDGRRTLVVGLFLALTFLQGGIYLLMYTGLAFLVLPWLTARPKHAWLITIKAAAWAVGLAAVKLAPVLLWLKAFPDEGYASSAFTLPYLHKILAGRYLHGAEVFPGQEVGWHEYGAYLGPVVLGLALWGAIAHFRRRLTRGLSIAFVLTLLLSTSGPTLKPVFDLLPFFPRSNISRVILFSVIALCLLAAQGLHALVNKQRWKRVIILLLLSAAAIDLITLAYLLSGQAFVVMPKIPLPPPARPPIEFTSWTFPIRVNGVDYTRAYAATLAGYGTLNYCTPLGPSPAVRTIHDEGPTSFATVTDEKGTIETLAWSPNQVAVTGTATSAAVVILNASWAPGWQANGQIAHSGDHPGLAVGHGPFSISFSYWPPGLTAGITLTTGTLLVAVGSLFRRGARRSYV